MAKWKLPALVFAVLLGLSAVVLPRIEAQGLVKNSGASVAGADTQVQFNDGGALGGDAGLVYNKTTDVLTAGTTRVGDGTQATPSISFTNYTNTGFYSAGDIRVILAGSEAGRFLTNFAGNSPALWMNGQGGAVLFGTGLDTAIARNAAGVVEINNGTLGTYRDAKLRMLRVGQATAPTCSASCGTSPSVTGSDTAMTVTMGATGVPASPFTVTFNGTWASAPSCTANATKTGMVAGKAPILVVASTTTVAITTNGTAPATSDTYAIHCIGVS